MLLAAALFFAGCAADTVDVRPHAQSSILQAWSKSEDGSNLQETPITRLVDVLKDMQVSLKKEMDKDEELYELTACWCDNNKYQKSEAIKSAEAQIASLESTIEELTGKSADLKSLITETASELEADQEELAKATALRQQQLKAFQQYEVDAIQNIETLKAAIVVLGKHQAAFPQVSLLALGSRHKLKWSTSVDRQFDRFLSDNDFGIGQGSADIQLADHAYSEFLHNQEPSSAPTTTIASHDDEAEGLTRDIPLDRQFDRFLSDNDFATGQDSDIQVSAVAPTTDEHVETKASHHDEVVELNRDLPLDRDAETIASHDGDAETIASHHDEAVELKRDVLPDRSGLLDRPAERQFDRFMGKNEFAMQGSAGIQAADHAVSKFLEERTTTSVPTTSQRVKSIWSHHDEVVVAKAMHAASLFLQAHGRAAYSQPSGGQSGEILGVMKQLKKDMEDDLSEAQKSEVERAGAFTELRNAKTAEIAAGDQMLEKKKAELAKAEFELANAKEDLAGLETQLPEDQKFLSNLEKTCDEADKNFVVRKKSRLDEIQAVSDTLEILTSDEARDTFSGAFKFLQVEQSSKVASSRRALAASMLRKVARRAGNPELSVLANSVELDAFTEVKAAIDSMISTLKIQQADEVKKKDWCNMEFDENKMQTMKAEDLKEDQTTSIEDQNLAIKSLADEITIAKGQIRDMQVDLQRATDNRVKENADFQKTVADQVGTQEILAQAREKLAAFYDAKMLVQVGHKGAKHSTMQPPVPQAEHKKSSGINSVMSLIEKLISDAKELEKESRTAENEAEAEYQTFVADTNASVKELQEAVVTKSEAKAKTDKELVETEEALANTMTDLEDLAKYKAGLHKDCDFLLKNLVIRQEARAGEIEGLQQAKQILSGAMQ